MARVTSLGINIFSHWNGRGMRRARRNLNQFGDGLNETQRDANRFNKSINRMDKNSRLLARSLKRPRASLRRFGDDVRSSHRDTNRFRRALRALGRGIAAPFRGIGHLRRGFVSLGESLHDTRRRSLAFSHAFRMLGKRIIVVGAIALLPVIAQLARLGAGLLAMGAAASIGFAGFAAAALAASRRAFELAEANKKMSKSQRRHVAAVHAMRRAWNKFLDSKIGGKLLVPMNIAIKAITRNMDKLKPLVNAIAPIFKKIARAFANWMDRSSGFKRFVKHMKKHGVPIMRNLSAAARSVLKFLGRAFRDSLPLARRLSKRIREGARALAKWGAKGGFERWLRRTKKHAPAVRKMFRELRKLLPKIAEAIKGLVPVATRLSIAFLKIANNLSPGQIRALITVWILAKPALLGLKAAVIGYNIAKKIFNKRTHTGTAAMKKSTSATKKGGKAMRGFKGALKGARGGMGKFLGKLGALVGGGFGLKKLIKRLGGAKGALSKMKGKLGLLRGGIASLITKLGGGAGLIKLLGRGGLAGVFMLVQDKLFGMPGDLKELVAQFEQLEDIVGDVVSIIGDLGSKFKAVTNGPLSAFKGAIDTGGNILEDVGGAIGDAAHALFGSGLHQALGECNKRWKPFNKHTNKAKKHLKGTAHATKRAEKKLNGFSSGLDRSYRAAKRFGNGAKSGKKHTSMFGRSLHIAGKNTRKFGHNAKKGGGGLRELSKQTGISRKKLRHMGITGKEADKMLRKFGHGAIRTGKDVKNKAGGAFKNGARNLKKNWGGATLFVRRTTRKRLVATIHQARDFRNKIGRVFDRLGKGIKKKWGGATESIRKTAKRNFGRAEKQAKQFRKTVGKQFDRVKRDIKKKWGSATDQIRDLARKRFNKTENQAKQFRKTIGKQFERVRKHIKKVWGGATHLVQTQARQRFNKTAGIASRFRKDMVKTFERIRKAVKKSWGDVLDNVRNRAKRRLGEVRKAVDNALKKIRKSFDKTTDAIKKIWQGRLPSIFKKPIKFFVETVYNKGLRKAWNNTFANLPGIKELGKANLGFASGGLAQRGGKVRGPGGPTADKIPAALSSGEYVVRAKAVKQIGVDVLNRVNQGVGGDLPKRGVPLRDDFVRRDVAQSHFAGGGMIGSRQRHNQCSAYAMKFAEGGFIPYPSVDINEVYKRAIAAGVKAAKKSKMLGMTSLVNFSGGNMSNSDDGSGAGGFDWGTNLYQDVAKRVGRRVLNPFMRAGFTAANKGTLRPAGEWAEVAPTHLKQIMDELLQYIWEHANTGCGTGGFAPFRPWRAGDGARVSFRGVTLDKRTRAMCLASESKLRKRMSYFQGSWSGAAASAGTHMGGGAVDTGPASFKTSAAMRASGFAAWARGPKFGSGSFSPHVHGIAVGNKNLSGPAKAQVKAFQAGKDGLAGNRPDNQPGGAVGSCTVAGGGCGVKRWAGLATLALKLGGCASGPSNLSKFLRLMKQESCGNPNAVNNWDSNAAAGNASRGLMQVIPSTFKANHVKGTSNNIFDPLANMAASVRYIKRRYGCHIPQAPYAFGGLVTNRQRGGHPRSFMCGGGEVVKQAMPWIFDTGGTLRPGLNVVDNRTGGPERLHRDRHGDHDHRGCTHIHIHGNVFAKDERQFRDMVVSAVSEGKRRKRI
jgi:transglycosylase-like protein with SLT domain